MKKLLLLMLIMVGCHKFPGKQTYEDNRKEIEKYLASQHLDIRNIECVSNELIPYADRFCSDYFDDDNLESFQQCFKDGGSIFNLQYTQYQLEVVNCSLKESIEELEKFLGEVEGEQTGN